MHDEPHAAPVSLVVDDDLRRPRASVLFRLLLALPHLVVAWVWGIAASLVAVALWVALLISGRAPVSLQGFVARFVRYSAQVAAYVAADFSVPHQAVVTRFDEHFPTFTGTTVLDLGCGSGDVTARFALGHPECRIVGVDAGPVMLAAARDHFTALGIVERIEILERHLPDPSIRSEEHNV